MNLLTVSNAKTRKGELRGYLTFILHLAPNTVSGYNTCPMASKGCALACLNTAGRGAYANVQNARVRRTKMFFENRENFMLQLMGDIATGIARAERLGMIPVFRLNGTSDIRWETIPVMGYRNIMEMFPEITFYDYTALSNRKNIPSNYHLTFSKKESNDDAVTEMLLTDINIAVVFKTLPETYLGRMVIRGDDSDLRFLDPKGVIVGLTAKGRAKKDTSGFVVHS